MAKPKSEDAFDAAVSVLMMDAHWRAFDSLPPADETSGLEGEIWVPPEDAGGSRLCQNPRAVII